MKLLVRILNTVVAICCIILVVLIFWFLYLVFAKGFGGVGAVYFILSEISRWWNMFLSQCISFFR